MMFIAKWKYDNARKDAKKTGRGEAMNLNLTTTEEVLVTTLVEASFVRPFRRILQGWLV